MIKVLSSKKTVKVIIKRKNSSNNITNKHFLHSKQHEKINIISTFFYYKTVRLDTNYTERMLN